MKKVRLDQLVFDLGLTESRERAKTTIMSGLVFVNGQRADKPGMPVSPEAKVEVRGEALPFVSRGGFKLDKALKSKSWAESMEKNGWTPAWLAGDAFAAFVDKEFASLRDTMTRSGMV